WSSDVCSSDLAAAHPLPAAGAVLPPAPRQHPPRLPREEGPCLRPARKPLPLLVRQTMPAQAIGFPALREAPAPGPDRFAQPALAAEQFAPGAAPDPGCLLAPKTLPTVS